MSSTIGAPSKETALKPTISLTLPSVVGTCDNISLDLSNSRGSGAREWAFYSLKVSTVIKNDIDSSVAANRTVKVKLLNTFLDTNKHLDLLKVHTNKYLDR